MSQANERCVVADTKRTVHVYGLL